jgi:DNA-binding NarL/FixJ family response regulator
MDVSANKGKSLAIILSNDLPGLAQAESLLSTRGIETLKTNSLEQCIEQVRNSSPDLLIVEDDTVHNSGIRAIREALKISWTISSILVSSLDEAQIHDRAEGLGILGSLSSLEDSEGLKALLDSFDRIRSA